MIFFISIIIISRIFPYSVHEKLQNICICVELTTLQTGNIVTFHYPWLSLFTYVLIYLHSICICTFSRHFFVHYILFFSSGKIHVNGCMTEVRSSLFKHVMPLLLICALVSLIVGLIELLLLLCAVCFADHIKVNIFDIWHTLKAVSHFSNLTNIQTYTKLPKLRFSFKSKTNKKFLRYLITNEK